MSGLCGWIGDMEPAAARATIARMAAALPTGPGTAANSIQETAFALAYGGPAGEGRCHVDASFAAVIHGRPRWLAPELAAVAAEHGAARALVEGYRRHGRAIVERIGGPASFALVDRHRRAALVAIDRMGIETLCHAALPGGGLAFASAASSLRRHPEVGSNLDPQAIFDYLFFTRVPAPATIYRDQRKLLPAQVLWHEGGRTDVAFYWKVPYVDPGRDDIGALKEDLLRTLAESLSRAKEGDDPGKLGAFLSGGVDSTTVLAFLARSQGAGVKAFSIGFDADGFDEMDYARAAARHFGAEHHEYYVTPDDVAKAVPEIAAAYDEPFGNTSAVPALYCARMARAHGIATLHAGDGGDELFGGNKRYVLPRRDEVYAGLPAWSRAMIASAVTGRLARFGGALGARARSYVERAGTPLPDRLEHTNFLRGLAAAECFGPDWATRIDVRHPFAVMREAYGDARSAARVNRMMHLDLRLVLADDDLRKVRLTCWREGVDVRFPMLDEDLVALAASVSPELHLKDDQLRWFFKSAVADVLPRITLEKEKHGFGLPFGAWLASHRGLAELAFDSLAALKRRDIVRPAFLDRVVAEHRGTHGSHNAEVVWVLMMLEQWLETTAASDRAFTPDDHGDDAAIREPAMRRLGAG